MKRTKRFVSLLMAMVLMLTLCSVSFAAEIAPYAVTQTMTLGQMYYGSTANEIMPARDEYDEYYLRLTEPATITFVITHNDPIGNANGPSGPNARGEGGFQLTLDYGAGGYCALLSYHTEYTVSLAAGLHNISIMSDRFTTATATYTMFAYKS